MDRSEVAFEVRDLTVRYDEKRALANVSTEIPATGVTALVGPSGCGKSTFLQCLNRLNELDEHCHVDGSIAYRGRAVTDVDPRELRRRVGLIFQRPNPFPTSIRNNIHLALREHGVRSRAERDSTTERVLRETGLWPEVHDRLDAPATQLSGGQQQRLCIARAIALDPEVLLMDEPCSALDPLAASTVETLIRSLSFDLPVILVTHSLAQTRRLAQKVLVFWVRDSAGTIIEQGPVGDVIADPREPETKAYVRGEQG